MKLQRSSQYKKDAHFIILARKTSDLSEILTEDEIRFVNDRLKKDKTEILIHRLGQIIFIQILEESEKPEFQIKENLRKSAAKLGDSLNSHDIETASLVHPDVDCGLALAFAEGLALSNYQFLKYFKDKDKKKNSFQSLNIICDKIKEQEIDELQSLIQAVYYARDLVNEPLSYLTAEQLAKEIQKMGTEAGFSVEVLTKKKIESLKMGGLLSVNKGSVDPPTFSILEYKHPGAKNSRPVVLVGKGIVYDTGGLSLKPTPDSMDYMKCDMAGAAAVAGAFYAIASAKLPVHVIGLIPATDNRPDGNAYVPGDVIKMYDGTTVEVLNTDAEGRMILADALSWAKQYKPELVIDIATLTGSAHIAIGTSGMVGMGNAGKEVTGNLLESGYDVYERIAEFPFWEEYGEMMKSDIADLKNIGGKLAGAITAGKFLENFTDYPYIHLDIAGPSFLKKQDSYRTKGGTGVGVRLFFDYLKKISG